MRPTPDLNTEERAEVKKVSRELLARLKELLVRDWRRRSSTRAQLMLAPSGAQRVRALNHSKTFHLI